VKAPKEAKASSLAGIVAQWKASSVPFVGFAIVAPIGDKFGLAAVIFDPSLATRLAGELATRSGVPHLIVSADLQTIELAGHVVAAIEAVDQPEREPLERELLS
jgi:hypothetical protein